MALNPSPQGPEGGKKKKKKGKKQKALGAGEEAAVAPVPLSRVEESLMHSRMGRMLLALVLMQKEILK
jgi:hypothetical protein